VCTYIYLHTYLHIHIYMQMQVESILQSHSVATDLTNSPTNSSKSVFNCHFQDGVVGDVCFYRAPLKSRERMREKVTHCNTLQRTAKRCNILQHTATHCNTLQHAAKPCGTMQHTTTHVTKRKVNAKKGGCACMYVCVSVCV